MFKNLCQIKPIHIDTILGYEIYIPDAYYNPLGYCKKNCPLWIKVDDNGDCHVHIISNDSKWKEDVTRYISTLPKKHGIAFYPLTEDVVNQFGIDTQDSFSLSSVARDENGEIKAIIVIDKDTEEDNTMFISYVHYADILVLQQLRNHILSDYNTERFKMFFLKYYPSSEDDLTSTLGLLKDDERNYSYYQFV